MSEPVEHPARLYRHPFAGWALAIVLLVAILYGPGIVRGEIPYFMDIVAPFYPAKVHAARLLADGQLPLWNRTVYGGTAFLSNPQWGLLYPGNWPFLLLPTGHVYTLLNAVHVLIMALGMYFWLGCVFRRRGIASAFLAGVLSVVGGWTWAHLAFGAYLQVAAWFPWMLWAWSRHLRTCEEKQNEKLSMLFGILAGFFGAMQWLAGAPQLALYCMAGLWFFALVEGGVSLKKRALRPLLTFLVPQAVLAIGLSAPQWMTARAFMQECNRAGGLPMEKVLAGALDLKGIYRAWIGGTGTPENAEQILYPGLISILLALIGMFGLPLRRRGEHSLLPFRLAAGGLLMVSILSCYRPVASMLYRVLPLYDQFHDPMRVLFLGYIATIVLAALGFAELWRVSRRVGQRHAQVLFDAALVALALAAVVDVLDFSDEHIDTRTIEARYFENARMPLAVTGAMEDATPRFLAVDHGLQYTYNYTRSDFPDSLLPGLSPLYGLEDIQGYDPAIPWRYDLYVRRANLSPHPAASLYPSHFGIFRNLDSPWLGRFGKLAAVGPAKHLWPLQGPQWIGPKQGLRIDLRKQGRPWTVTQAGLDDVRFYMGYLRNERWTGAPADRLSVRFVSAGGDVLGRLEAKGLEEPMDSMGSGWLWSDVLPPGKWQELPEGVEVVPAHRAEVTSATVSKSGEKAAFIEIVNAHEGMATLFYSIGLPEPSIPFEETAVPDLYLSTFETGFPSQAVVIGSPATPSGDQAHSRAAIQEYSEKALRYRPDVTVIEEPQGLGKTSEANLVSGYEIIEQKANRLVVKVDEGSEAGWLVLAEPYQNGWSCRVDGEQTNIYPADTLFRAVYVRGGGSQVVFKYWPPGFTTGLIVAFGSLVFGIIFLTPSLKRSVTD